MPHFPPPNRVAAINALFAQICQATPSEARNLSMLLTLEERAAVALSCNARTHLRAQGRAIAGACTLDSLVAEGGQAGRSLFTQAETEGDTWGATVSFTKRPVSLAG